MSDILRGLNAAQKSAAMHVDGPLLVLAGAGSGKTKTLTTRLAYLIDEIGIPAQNTLTLTFTNKASMEMRQRALSLIGSQSSVPILATFHRFGLMFLKFYITHLGRKNDFSVIDDKDKNKILSKIEKKIKNIDLTTREISSEISYIKNSLLGSLDEEKEHLREFFYAYQQELLDHNLVDFDDLLLLPFNILSTNDALAARISQTYSYIMVDEYQDTNYLQFQLLRKLCFSHENLCVVGDDDQSIYGWRGADIQNILQFNKHFKDVKTIKLEENYRSTEEILNAANLMITHNTQRIGKTLRSIKGSGEAIKNLSFEDSKAEAFGIAQEIQNLLHKGVRADDIAVLFRLNAMSKGLEENLNRLKVPHMLVGTMRFYERAEIKDMLAYLRYLSNKHDDFSLERIINQPKRGIGEKTQEKIFSLAREKKISVVECFLQGEYDDVLSSKVLATLREFFALLEVLREDRDRPYKMAEALLNHINILQAYEAEYDHIDRMANIKELLQTIKEYFEENIDSTMIDFFNNIALSSSLDDTQEGSVKCMSIHTSKGLEFDYVFVIGMEEKIFPHEKKDADLEEERRLAYVAFTRAKKKLYTSHANSRLHHAGPLKSSRFLQEAQILQGKNLDTQTGGFVKNDAVIHRVFGLGIVQKVEKIGQDMFLTISFGGLIRRIKSGFVEKV